jgi:Uma2 family endonuclease
MSAARPIKKISPQDYLKGEEVARFKHEFIDGRVYMMAGATDEHNRISSSFLISIGSKLRGRPCEPFGSDMKLRLQMPGHTRYYYPDAMVVCEPNPGPTMIQDRPVIVVEVMSSSSRRADLYEKREAYLLVPSLQTYLMVETKAPHVFVCQRQPDGQFNEFEYKGLDAVIPLDAIGAELKLSDLYERVTFRDDDETADDFNVI